METNTTINHGTLAPLLQSAVARPLESIKGKVASAGYRFCRLIAKGENSTLAQSYAVEVPAITTAQMLQAASYPALAAVMIASLEKLQDGICKRELGTTAGSNAAGSNAAGSNAAGSNAAGSNVITYSTLSLDELARFAEEDTNIGQLSEERIASWFESDVREMLIVALAERLGITETATDSEIKRCEQIANQTRDNLKKLSSKKPVMFDERVKAALNWALDSAAASDDTMAARLKSKLNATVDAINLADSLGF
jgi:hypothetical protein